MTVLHSDDVRRRDALSEERGLSLAALMETAGRAVAERASAFGLPRVTVVCGRGHNGGDGLVAARHLAAAGHSVDVLMAGEPASPLVAGQLRALRACGVEAAVCGPSEAAERLRQASSQACLFVDALLGVGLRGAVREGEARLIDALNAIGQPVLSVDIPSGVDSDSGSVRGPAVRAASTVTFDGPKPGLLRSPGRELAGEVWVALLGTPAERGGTTEDRLLTAGCVRGLLPARPAAAHKGTFGRLALFAGSPGMWGAGLLSGTAALRTGAGIVAWAAAGPESGAPIVGERPELMPRFVSGDAAGLADAVLALAGGATCLAAGPGLGTDPAVRESVRLVVSRWDRTGVLDADGVRAFAGEPERLRSGSLRWVLTPHAGEMAALLGRTVEEVTADPRRAALEAAVSTGQAIVLKGSPTVVAAPDGQVWWNVTGNPGMATAGSGDVLTGIIGALLAQGLAPLDAAACGAYLQGLAGDLAAGGRVYAGLTAGDVAGHVPEAMERLRQAEVRPSPVFRLMDVVRP